MNIEEQIKILLRNTRTKSRNKSLIEIANVILDLKKSFGNLEELGKIVSLTPGMLNEFLQVFRLTEDTQKLVNQRKIDSVKAIKSLAAFDAKDQYTIASMLVEKALTNQDLRILHPLRRQFPKEDIKHLISQIINSKDRKISIIKFLYDRNLKPNEKIKSTFQEVVGTNNFLDIVAEGNSNSIKITHEGEKKLRQIATSQGKTLQEFINTLLIENA